MGWLRDRKDRRLAALEELRQARKLVGEDVTVFGEQLSGLHEETLTDVLSSDAQADYRRALEEYDAAKEALAAATTADAVRAVNPVLDEGRFRLACVLARRDGEPLPTRREPCFFNPQHGPGVEELEWTPPHGVARSITVCRSDLNRLTAGQAPEVRLVRVGDRYVPWYAAEQARGALLASVGAAAVGGVPGYLMLEADLARMVDQLNSPGGGALG